MLIILPQFCLKNEPGRVAQLTRLWVKLSLTIERKGVSVLLLESHDTCRNVTECHDMTLAVKVVTRNKQLFPLQYYPTKFAKIKMEYFCTTFTESLFPFFPCKNYHL